MQLYNTTELTGSIYANNDISADPAALPLGTFNEVVANYLGALFRANITDNSGKSHDILVGINALNGSINIDVFIKAEESNGATSATPGIWVGAGSVLASYNPTTGKSSNVSSVGIAGFAAGATGNITLDLRGLSFVNTLSPSSTPLSAISLTGIETQEVARNALIVAKNRQDELIQMRGAIGASQSRLEVANAVLAASRENYLAAASRIQDIDVAHETSLLMASQIKQQAAASILAQANNQPSLVLSLLQ